jgi:hypothetical protein
MLSSAIAMTQEKKMLQPLLDISSTLFRSVLMTINVRAAALCNLARAHFIKCQIDIVPWSSRQLSRIIGKHSSCDVLVTQIDLGPCCT